MSLCNITENTFVYRVEPYCIDITQDGYFLANFTVTECGGYDTSQQYAKVGFNRTYPDGTYASNYCNPLDLSPYSRYTPQVLTCYHDFSGLVNGTYEIDVTQDGIFTSYPFSIYTTTSCPGETKSTTSYAEPTDLPPPDTSSTTTTTTSERHKSSTMSTSTSSKRSTFTTTLSGKFSSTGKSMTNSISSPTTRNTSQPTKFTTKTTSTTTHSVSTPRTSCKSKSEASGDPVSTHNFTSTSRPSNPTSATSSKKPSTMSTSTTSCRDKHGH